MIFLVWKLYQSSKHQKSKRNSFRKLQYFLILVGVTFLTSTVIWGLAWLNGNFALERISEAYVGLYVFLIAMYFHKVTLFVFENPEISKVEQTKGNVIALVNASVPSLSPTLQYTPTLS
jgi:hypothetical protein